MLDFSIVRKVLQQTLRGAGESLTLWLRCGMRALKGGCQSWCSRQRSPMTEWDTNFGKPGIHRDYGISSRAWGKVSPTILNHLCLQHLQSLTRSHMQQPPAHLHKTSWLASSKYWRTHNNIYFGAIRHRQASRRFPYLGHFNAAGTEVSASFNKCSSFVGWKCDVA